MNPLALNLAKQPGRKKKDARISDAGEQRLATAFVIVGTILSVILALYYIPFAAVLIVVVWGLYLAAILKNMFKWFVMNIRDEISLLRDEVINQKLMHGPSEEMEWMGEVEK